MCGFKVGFPHTWCPSVRREKLWDNSLILFGREWIMWWLFCFSGLHFLDPVTVEWPDPIRVALVVAEQDHPQSNTEWVIAASCVTHPSLMCSCVWLAFASFTKHSDIITHAARAVHWPTPSSTSLSYSPYTLGYSYSFSIAKQNANDLQTLMKRYARYLFRPTMGLID